jgi:hypothetical protein
MPQVTGHFQGSGAPRCDFAQSRGRGGEFPGDGRRRRAHGGLEATTLNEEGSLRMKPLFVTTRDGERHILWPRFLGAAAVLALAAALAAEVLSFLLMGRFSLGALVFAETMVVLLLARLLIRAAAYQPINFEQAESS